jgi:hypothetical protein
LREGVGTLRVVRPARGPLPRLQPAEVQREQHHVPPVRLTFRFPPEENTMPTTPTTTSTTNKRSEAAKKAAATRRANQGTAPSGTTQPLASMAPGSAPSPALASLPENLRKRCVTVRQLVRALTGHNLKTALNGANLDAVVVLQRDPEGNGYGPLDVEGIDPDISLITASGHHFDLEPTDNRKSFPRGEETVVVLVPMG